MRELFPGYYRPTKEEFDELWRNCIFSFDTNVLLHIYRYSPQMLDRFFVILNSLKDRIWIPHQVAYEYHKDRLNVIFQQLQPYDEINKILDDSLENLKRCLNSYNKRHYFISLIDKNKIIKNIERANQRVKKQLYQAKSQHPDFLNADESREKITELFDGKVGNSYSEDELNKIYKEAEKRFKQNKPPGYMDERGKNKKDFPDNYADVIIWFQLLDYAKSTKKPFVFVTDDEKEDWWLEHRGKTISPRPELLQEMLSEAGVSFYMYKSDQFMELAGNFLKLPDQSELIEEAKEIRLQGPAEEYENKELQSLTNLTSTYIQELPRAIEQIQRSIANSSNSLNHTALLGAIEQIQRSVANSSNSLNHTALQRIIKDINN